VVLIRDAVATVRSMMTGALLDEVSVLLQPFDPLVDEQIVLKYPKRSIGVGSTLCVGLNTFTAMAVSGDGALVTVLPARDGGPTVAAPANEIVVIRPQFTTWAIVREIQSEIDSMSSPDVGLFQPFQFEASVDDVSGTYVVPDQPDGRVPFRLLKAEWRIEGTDAWQAFTEVEWQPNTNTIRVFSQPDGRRVRFTMAYPFGQIADLNSTYLDVGVPGEMEDIPNLGAASTLALGWEGRRVQPFSQGDSRRANEIQPGSNASLSRQFEARKQQRVNEELARLTRLFGWRHPSTTGPTTGSWMTRSVVVGR
jgi:hypothetical protein